ncbi:hypothetical protein ACI2KS_12515 [Pseudomonas sp. NPDC087358]|uniref:hypothetical protein n=1 Tax=Pseudomonas sp. NPDC087358 TaxID=3364439 RepID=UPI00384F7D3B
MDRESHRLLERLLLAHGPGGQEDEVRSLCQAQLARHCDEVTLDRAGNVIGLIRSAQPSHPDDGIRVMAHLDEIAMLVKRVDANGIPTENTHGFEIIDEAGIDACAATLIEFLLAERS